MEFCPVRKGNDNLFCFFFFGEGKKILEKVSG